jgi:hypothetical protein
MLARSPICPCCGHAFSDGDDPTRLAVAGVRLSPSQRTIVNALLPQFGQWVHTDRIVWALYGNVVDGGPDDPSGVIKVHVCRIQKTLASIGLRIECQYGGRANKDSYRRLVRLAA